jgi:hypothetical protein
MTNQCNKVTQGNDIERIHIARNQATNKQKKKETRILFSRWAAAWIYLSVRMPAAACSLELLPAAA